MGLVTGNDIPVIVVKGQRCSREGEMVINWENVGEKKSCSRCQKRARNLVEHGANGYTSKQAVCRWGPLVEPTKDGAAPQDAELSLVVIGEKISSGNINVDNVSF